MPGPGRKPSSDLSHLSCPNPDCPAFQKPGGSRIVANGTYRTKRGSGQRFRCKTCGSSFCRESGSLFQGLHSSEAEVLTALKVLAKGLSFRRTAELLQVRPDTLRHWLTRLLEHSEAVNRRLLQEPGISPVELDALWQSVQQGALRQRAVLWRQRSGWRQG